MQAGIKKEAPPSIGCKPAIRKLFSPPFFSRKREEAESSFFRLFPVAKVQLLTEKTSLRPDYFTFLQPTDRKTGNANGRKITFSSGVTF